MDVVKTNIRRIGGIVDMQSEPGRGSILKIKIPLTLAIIPALVVKVQGERFAVPQVSLLELVRLEGDQTHQGIEMIHGAPVYRLRGRLLPLVNLREQLGYPAEDGSGKVNIVVLQADGRPFGLIVDEITDTEEIVVKPLWSQLKQIRIFAGATIMGDGSVALILDVLGLAQQSHVIEENRQDRLTEYNTSQDESQGDRETLLLFRVGDNHMAVPLDQVDRLEELPLERVERTGDQDVIQYRGRILPLVRPENHLPERRSERRGDGARPATLQVVVYSHEGISYGLVVDGIEDIAHEAIAVRREATREGVLGVIVVNERITEMLDLQRLARLVG
jgi:two-component system chemotaxis sensor kinase CheA